MTAIDPNGAPTVREMVARPDRWPESPYLVVERRRNRRTGDPWCFLKTSSDKDVQAVVHVAPTWPPPATLDPTTTLRFEYNTFEELLKEGWHLRSSSERATYSTRL